jgi:hypothetical protein
MDAVAEIEAAAQIIDPSGHLVKALAETGILADASVFTAALGMARSIAGVQGRRAP